VKGFGGGRKAAPALDRVQDFQGFEGKPQVQIF
jgi:hypothetical protein